MAKAYDAIIGNAKAASAGINVNAAVDYIVSQQSYFTAYGHDALGAKAAMAGFVMYAGINAGVGSYAEATKAFLTNAYDGKASYGGALLAAKAPAEAGIPASIDAVALVAQPTDHHDAGAFV